MRAGGRSSPVGDSSLRILFAGERWPGSDAYAYERAFRRAGHAVTAIESATFLPTGWRSLALKALRRVLTPALIAEYERALIDAANFTRPHLFVGFKAPYVTVRAIEAIKSTGAIAINVYPDPSVMAYGPWIPKALPHYHWVFTTKTFGLADMKRLLGIVNSSFFPPAFDPELHFAVPLSFEDRVIYGADVSFIGTYQTKSEKMLAALSEALPDLSIRVWGAQWDKSTDPRMRGAVENRVVIGSEYTKTVCASRINLSFLREQIPGGSSGDLITHRTFAMPACGGFMLHERTPEVVQYFEEGREIALFSNAAELIEKVRYYLAHEDERRQVACAGRDRALTSGYSVDARIAEVLAKYRELASAREDR